MLAPASQAKTTNAVLYAGACSQAKTTNAVQQLKKLNP
jgi:hypothetical protein